MDKQTVHERIRGGVIVSCQALPDEPLFGSANMVLMAKAALEGGAVGIRCNSAVDIAAIHKEIDLPLIGIVKRDYEGSEVFITATALEIEEVAKAGAHILAMDATCRPRPNGVQLANLVAFARAQYPHLLLMADTSTFEEAVTAKEMGFDYIGTTLCGYTEYTKGTPLPNIALPERIVRELGVSVIAEGGIWTREELRAAMDTGVHAAVVGTAITRPRDITKRFVAALER